MKIKGTLLIDALLALLIATILAIYLLNLTKIIYTTKYNDYDKREIDYELPCEIYCKIDGLYEY